MTQQKPLIIGARDSLLSRAQCEEAYAFMRRMLPHFAVEWRFFSTPGDRDRTTPLPDTPADFFTRDLDDALRVGTIEAALHSAKDVPSDMPDDLDWFWLPEGEDPRDVILTPSGRALDDLLRDTHNTPRIGISSVRREEYARKHFPQAHCFSIRGNVDDRCAQMQRGDYDMLILAAAGVHRLNYTHLVAEYIPLDALASPDGQGNLALTFAVGHPFWTQFRQLCVAPVIFAGAGPGEPGGVTRDVIDALRHCTLCVHDADTDDILAAYLPQTARALYVGKRAGENSTSQETINTLLTTHARRGDTIVRLKGGDPGIFGRLTEEIAAIERYALPYRILPGISSLLAATTSTGFFLTRRGGARGFTALTARTAGSGASLLPTAEEESAFPRVFFMGIHTAQSLAQDLLARGTAPTTPVAMVARAGRWSQEILTMSLEELAHDTRSFDEYTPGLLLIGTFADEAHRILPCGPLAGMRIALAVTPTIQEKAARAVHRFMGTPIPLPMISLQPHAEAHSMCAALPDYDWIILSSPTAVDIFCDVMRHNQCDIRSLPRLLVSGPRTAARLNKHGLYQITIPQESFGSEGILQTACASVSKDARILRLRSDVATDALAQSLRARGFSRVDDRVLYTNTPRVYPSLPVCDALVFAGASQVHAYAAHADAMAFSDVPIAVMGVPTEKAIRTYAPDATVIVPPRATIEDAITALAAHVFAQKLSHHHFKK